MLDAGALARKIAALPRPLLLAFDVDGTLAPIVADPSRAGVPPSVVEQLRKLCAVPQIAIAIVTGRDARGLVRMMDLACAWSALEHGRRVLEPGALAPDVVSESDAARLSQFRAWAEREAIVHGARTEEKDGSVAVHVRELAARDPVLASALLEQARSAARAAGLHPRDGRQVVEAALVPADKRAALVELMARTSAASCLYAGDDKTDDDAIAFAAERGIGIFVRSSERPDPPPGSTLVLDGPQELWRVIEELDALL